ncbi:hypothetical protein BKH46_04880 [Helicobacter sp. 12S02634-8]|uniref:hypothetical protein n=1 Tax=Helicobacter sp. 12S02634-8 TaxID=1476199 RepID=UPI000BA7A2EE|nr:hypothetical protein [Helicobacter sp. 12S02634-8]PAF47058.1 hypothetical protein BKH46_04880 [Helicobacter sp. 12S02634-8]
MKNIFFIGAGGFGSECYQTILEVMAIDKNICFKGFLSTSNDLAPYGLEHLFLGHYDDYAFGRDDYAVIAIGSPIARFKIYHLLKNRGVKFYNLISPRALVTGLKDLGEANIIAPFSSLAYNVKIGNANLINSTCAIGHDSQIGSYNVIGSYCAFSGFSSIQDGNYLATRITLFPKAKVGSNNKISAGSIVFKRIKDHTIAFGNPAEVIGTHEIFEFN